MAPTPASTTLTVAAGGDLMFARDVVTLMEQHGTGHPFERVAPLLAGSDLLLGNLEGTFTEQSRARPKFDTFRVPPALATTLGEAGFDIVSLANNHALDFGTTGLLDTLDRLAGAVGSSLFATAESAGTARADVDLVTSAIAGVAGDVDFVIAVFHFGREYDPTPTAQQRELAHAAVDAGAALVIGHHAHVLQPWECRGDALNPLRPRQLRL